MSVKIRERPKGSGVWWIFIDHQGKRKAMKIGHDRGRALEVAKKVEARLILGKMGLDDKPAPLFKEYAEKWISMIVPAQCKRTTTEDYQRALKKYILPEFGKKSINEINRMQVKEFLIPLYDHLSHSMVNRLKIAMSGIFNLAIDDEVITMNPTFRLGKFLKKKKQNPTGDILSRDELSLLMNTFQKYFPEHYPMALTLARTGMRIGEAIGLQWGDIDFNGHFIMIQRSISRSFMDTPKSGLSRRVDMSLQLNETLWKLKRERSRNYGDNMPPWVFINNLGNPVHCDNWRERVFNKALEKAELRRIRPHDLRHTCASLLLQDGQSMVYVRDQLGHSSIKITVDVYGHLIPGANKGAVDRLDDNTENEIIRNPGATTHYKSL